jgi:hypothetical protein
MKCCQLKTASFGDERSVFYGDEILFAVNETSFFENKILSVANESSFVPNEIFLLKNTI